MHDDEEEDGDEEDDGDDEGGDDEEENDNASWKREQWKQMLWSQTNHLPFIIISQKYQRAIKLPYIYRSTFLKKTLWSHVRKFTRWWLFYTILSQN